MKFNRVYLQPYPNFETETKNCKIIKNHGYLMVLHTPVYMYDIKKIGKSIWLLLKYRISVLVDLLGPALHTSPCT